MAQLLVSQPNVISITASQFDRREDRSKPAKKGR